jgi:serine/threonine protein kinase
MRKLSQNTIGLVTNLADGSLHDVIHGPRSKYPWYYGITMDDWKINFSKEITSAMIYLNNRDPPIHHRDLKSKNVLV